MRKAVSDGGEPAKEGSGKRYWVRAHPTESKPPAEGTPARARKARFLEPYRLSDERRAALQGCLVAAGVGDAESRALFATALEYDIAAFRQSSPRPEPAPAQPAAQPAAKPTARRSALVALPPTAAPAAPAASAAHPGLAPVAAGARALAGLIDALGKPERDALAAALRSADPFRRGYDSGYLEALCQELARLGRALEPAGESRATARSDATPTPPAPPEPALTEAERRFVRRVARVYEQCLEARPAATPDSPFLAVLGILAPEAGLPLPADPAALAAILAAR